MLNVFDGGTGNGNWYLSVADVEAGGTLRLVSWSLTLSGEDGHAEVPEASTWVSGIAVVLIIARRCRRS